MGYGEDMDINLADDLFIRCMLSPLYGWSIYSYFLCVLFYDDGYGDEWTDEGGGEGAEEFADELDELEEDDN